MLLCPAFDMVPLGTEDFALFMQGAFSSGTASAVTSAAVDLYDDADLSAPLSLTLTPAAVSGATGLYAAPLDVTEANGFERGKSYLYRWTGTVGGTAMVGVGRLKVT